MDIPVDSVTTLGHLIRQSRKSQGVRMDDIAGVSHVFVRDVERGKPTAEIGRVLHLLSELGIRMHVDVPSEVAANLSTEN